MHIFDHQFTIPTTPNIQERERQEPTEENETRYSKGKLLTSPWWVMGWPFRLYEILMRMRSAAWVGLLTRIFCVTAPPLLAGTTLPDCGSNASWKLWRS